MSKLAVVICAATYFFLAMAATLKTVDRSAFHSEINRTVEKIRHCEENLRQRMFELGPQPLEMHPELLDEYETNITNTIEKARPTIEGILKNVHPNLDTNVCQRFFTDLEMTGEKLVENSYMDMMMDFMKLINSIQGVSTLSHRRQEELKECARSNCNTIGNDVNMENVASQFCSHSEEITDEYVAMLNGTRTRKMLFSHNKYTSFISKAHDVVRKTRSCVYSSGSRKKIKFGVSVV